MRFVIGAVAFAAAFLAVPAQAAFYQFVVTATVTGYQATYYPNQIGCNGGPPGSIYCTGSGPYTETFTDLPAPVFSADGTGFFQTGGCHAFGCYSGTIIGGFAPNGEPAFSGIDFSFSFDNIPANQFRFGTAPTFSVRLLSVDGVPPVPEPATWALLMLGFGFLGYAMRRTAPAQVGVRFS
jgi:hypothetical protein